MIAICIGLSIITIICVALLLTLHEDIRKLNEQIDYKNESGSHFEVFTQSDIPSIKELQDTDLTRIISKVSKRKN